MSVRLLRQLTDYHETWYDIQRFLISYNLSNSMEQSPYCVLTVPKLVKKCSEFYATRRFTTATCPHPETNE